MFDKRSPLYLQLRREFENHLKEDMEADCDMGLIYTRIANKQVHFETVYKDDNKSNAHVEMLGQMANKHEFAFKSRSFASLGIRHCDALHICRNLASHHGTNTNFTNECVNELEEGEILNVPDFLKDAKFEDYLYPCSLYQSMMILPHHPPCGGF